MKLNLKGRSLLSTADLNYEEIQNIFHLAKDLKNKQKSGKTHHYLKGKTLGMVFEKSSTRTRVSFEAGMWQLGGYALYLSSNDLQLGRGESIPDTAKVLSRYLDGIMARTYLQKTVEDLAKHGSIPIINGLSDLEHPCQILSDLFTVWEKRKNLQNLKLAYIGDGNNVAHSLMLGCAKIGAHFYGAHPKGYFPQVKFIKLALSIAKGKSKIEIGTDPHEAVKQADIIYTDVWTSMGQEKEKNQRLKIFKPYQVNQKLIKGAESSVLVMHCLPAHRGEEITDEVMDGKNSIVFDQAENRLHVQKAILALLMGEK